jgi:hypothetical protein
MWPKWYRTVTRQHTKLGLWGRAFTFLCCFLFFCRPLFCFSPCSCVPSLISFPLYFFTCMVFSFSPPFCFCHCFITMPILLFGLSFSCPLYVRLLLYPCCFRPHFPFPLFSLKANPKQMHDNNTNMINTGPQIWRNTFLFEAHTFGEFHVLHLHGQTTNRPLLDTETPSNRSWIAPDAETPPFSLMNEYKWAPMRRPTSSASAGPSRHTGASDRDIATETSLQRHRYRDIATDTPLQRHRYRDTAT